MADPWVLRARNVGCIFPDTGRTHHEERVYRGIFVPALDVPAGGVTAVIGGSGSGKSTLLGVLTRLREDTLRMDAPKQLVFRNPSVGCHDLLKDGFPPPGTMAFVFQESQLIRTIAAQHNAELGARISGAAGAQARIDDLAQDLYTDTHMHVLSGTLSGGQAQRIAIIRALAVNPRLIVCDEPTSSLDDKLGNTVMSKIRDWAKEHGAAILWVTHNRHLAACYADHLILVAEAQVILDGLQPFDLTGLSEAERRAVIDAKMDLAGRVPPLTRSQIDATLAAPAALVHLPDALATPTMRKRPNMTARQRIALLVFLTGCGFSEIAAAGHRLRQKGVGRVLSVLRGSVAPLLRSLTWVLLLGLVVLYAVGTASDVTNRYLARSLQSPEISHFTMASQGTDENLEAKTLPKIEERLAAIATPDDVPLQTQLFGRREMRLTDVWLPQNDSCDASTNPGISRKSARLLVFEADEPLFSTMPVSPPNAVETPSDLIAFGGVVATPVLYDTLEKTELETLCIEMYGGIAHLPIVADAPRIPGGGDSVYTLALDEKTFRSVLQRTRPAALVDKEGRFTLPEYTRAALYFDFRQAEGIICAFGEIEYCEADALPSLGGFKLDTSIMQKIQGYTRIAQGAHRAFVILGACFAAAIGISTALAIRAFVEENTKPIAIMKAFGYGYLHVLLMLVSQVTLLLIAALVLFAVLSAGFHAFAASHVAATFDFPVQWLGVAWPVLMQSVTIILVIALGIALLVLGIWWIHHRYLGDTLQGV